MPGLGQLRGRGTIRRARRLGRRAIPERRREQRWPADLSGVILFGGRAAPAGCLVRNTSRFGARLVLSQAASLDDEFSLRIPHQQIEQRVRIRWCRDNQIGVETVPD